MRHDAPTLPIVIWRTARTITSFALQPSRPRPGKDVVPAVCTKRELEDEAAAARLNGEHSRALECYLELESRFPADGDWPRRAAIMHHRMGNHELAVVALERAIARYIRAGFTPKARATQFVIEQIQAEAGRSAAAQ